MDYSEINFGINTLFSIVLGAGAGFGVYFTMKGRLDLLENNQDNFQTNARTEVGNVKHEQKVLRTEFDNLNNKVDINQQASDKAISDLKEFIMQMKIDIIQEIHARK